MFTNTFLDETHNFYNSDSLQRICDEPPGWQSVYFTDQFLSEKNLSKLPACWLTVLPIVPWKGKVQLTISKPYLPFST